MIMFKHPIDQLRQSNEEPIPYGFCYLDMLMIGYSVAVTEEIMTDKEILQEISKIEKVDKEEEEHDFVNEIVVKPRPKE